MAYPLLHLTSFFYFYFVNKTCKWLMYIALNAIKLCLYSTKYYFIAKIYNTLYKDNILLEVMFFS